MQYHLLTLSPFFENTYIIFDETTKDTVILDPGCSNAKEQEAVQQLVSSHSLNPVAVINTHCHIDHIFGNRFITEYYRIPLFIPEKDLFLLNMGPRQGEMFGIPVEPSPAPTAFLPEAGDFAVGNLRFEVLSTPGHTPGEVCLYAPEDGLLFAGDVLFNNSIGRTDLWGGDQDTLLLSISQKLFILPESTKVLPGHGETTTIGHEKMYNPFFQ